MRRSLAASISATAVATAAVEAAGVAAVTAAVAIGVVARAIGTTITPDSAAAHRAWAANPMGPTLGFVVAE